MTQNKTLKGKNNFWNFFVHPAGGDTKLYLILAQG